MQPHCIYLPRIGLLAFLEKTLCLFLAASQRRPHFFSLLLAEKAFSFPSRRELVPRSVWGNRLRLCPIPCQNRQATQKFLLSLTDCLNFLTFKNGDFQSLTFWISCMNVTKSFISFFGIYFIRYFVRGCLYCSVFWKRREVSFILNPLLFCSSISMGNSSNNLLL